MPFARLTGNLIQGAGGAGFAVFQASEATLDGDTLQNNDTGLMVHSASKVRPGGQARPFTSRSNNRGIHVVRDAFAFVLAVVENNSSAGAITLFHSTLDFGGSISGNTHGAIVDENSAARFVSATIRGNRGAGVIIGDLSMVTFSGATVNGNSGGIDVVCNPQFSGTRGVFTDTAGGTTNCVEP